MESGTIWHDSPGRAVYSTMMDAALLPPPIIPGHTADPDAQLFGNTCYIYPTSDCSDWNPTTFSCWSSKDLLHWKNEGVIFDLAKSLSWANSRAWAPAMVFRDGRYFFYFVADYKIGVAVGPTPTGPFEDALGRPLLTRDSVSRSSPIDPFAFIDDDGRAYLYFGSGTLFFCRLNPDMITLAGEPTPILARAAHLREALLVFKRKGVYYFMWSENDARSADYQVGYGTSSSPEGPVEIPSDHVILKKRGLAAGTGHHSVIQIPGTDRWYIFYHRHLPAQGAGCLRETCLGRLEFAPDGGIMNVDPLAPVFPPGSKGESFAE